MIDLFENGTATSSKRSPICYRAFAVCRTAAHIACSHGKRGGGRGGPWARVHQAGGEGTGEPSSACALIPPSAASTPPTCCSWQENAFARFTAGFLSGCSERVAAGGGTKRLGTCIASGAGAVVVSPAAAQRASRSTAGDDIPRHNFIIN